VGTCHAGFWAGTPVAALGLVAGVWLGTQELVDHGALLGMLRWALQAAAAAPAASAAAAQRHLPSLASP
jgi:hypothetical protein